MSPLRLWEHQANRYLFVSQFVKDKNILDCGCSNGYGTEYLKRKGARTAIGGDARLDAINWAKEQYGERDGLKYMKLDARELPFEDNRFDLAVCLSVIEYIDGYQKAVSELKRVLKPQGTLIVSVPNKHRVFLRFGKINSRNVVEFTPSEFKRFLMWFFKDVKLYFQTIPLTERFSALFNNPYITTPHEITESVLTPKYHVKATTNLGAYFSSCIIGVCVKE